MAIMQKKYINLIGFCLIVAITFGVGLKLGQNSEAINVYSQSKKAPQVDQNFSRHQQNLTRPLRFW